MRMSVVWADSKYSKVINESLFSLTEKTKRNMKDLWKRNMDRKIKFLKSKLYVLLTSNCLWLILATEKFIYILNLPVVALKSLCMLNKVEDVRLIFVVVHLRN